MGKHSEELGSYSEFRAPWETETGDEAEIDKPKLKKLLFNARSAKAAALDERDEARESVTGLQKDLDAAKTELASTNGEEAQKKIDRLQAALDIAKEKVTSLESEKELSELRADVLQGVPANVAKYVTGTTQDELEKSLEAVKADFGIDDSDDGDDGDGELQVRTTPRSSLLNPADRKAGAPADGNYDFDKEAAKILGGGPFS